MLTDINETGLQQTKHEVESTYPHVRVETYKMDVTDETSIVAAHRTAVELLGRIDYAVNNAGTPGVMKPSTESSSAEFRFGIDINLFGVWMGQREQLKLMEAQAPNQRYAMPYHWSSQGTIVGPRLISHGARIAVDSEAASSTSRPSTATPAARIPPPTARPNTP